MKYSWNVPVNVQNEGMLFMMMSVNNTIMSQIASADKRNPVEDLESDPSNLLSTARDRALPKQPRTQIEPVTPTEKANLYARQL